MQNAIMGSFSDIFGQDTLSKWGSSYNPAGAGGQAAPLGMQPPPGPSAPIAPPGGGMERPMPPWMDRRGGGGRGPSRMEEF